MIVEEIANVYECGIIGKKTSVPMEMTLTIKGFEPRKDLDDDSDSTVRSALEFILPDGLRISSLKKLP